MTSMNWGLQQGMLGARQKTLTPSLNSVGPNRYLTREDFIKMIGVALLLHSAVFGIADLFHDTSVKDIPVRALSFKIGDTDRAAVPRLVMPAPPEPLPIPKALPVVKTPTPPPAVAKAPPKIVPQPAAKPVTTKPVPPAQRHQPTENPTPLQQLPKPAAPVETPAPAPSAPLAALPDPSLLSQPAVAANPQRFVRESVPQPAVDVATESAQAVRLRYEQEISAWVQKHKIYPTNGGGAKGRAVVRVRIDRSGNLRYYGIEESSGNKSFDAAALDMIQRANPMPAVPVDYPAGSLIDFLIPILF